jgi:rhodanese-related sulfurtransferase
MKDYRQMLAEANAAIESVAAADAVELVDYAGVVFIDLRDGPELERDGKIPGAVHAPRGMLEFSSIRPALTTTPFSPRARS